MSDRLYAEYFSRAFATRTEDADYYVRALEPGPKDVLELGCGTGRVSARLLAAGHRLTAVDHSEAMLAEFEHHLEASTSLRLINADARSLRLPERFDAVVLPFNVLGCLGSRHDLPALLRTAAAHCQRTAAVHFDVLNKQPWHVAGGRGVVPWMDLPSIPGGARVEEVWTCDGAEGRLVTVLYLSSLEGGESVELRSEFLFFDRTEIEQAAQDAGLEVISAVSLGDSVFYACEPVLSTSDDST